MIKCMHASFKYNWGFSNISFCSITDSLLVSISYNMVKKVISYTATDAVNVSNRLITAISQHSGAAVSLFPLPLFLALHSHKKQMFPTTFVWEKSAGILSCLWKFTVSAISVKPCFLCFHFRFDQWNASCEREIVLCSSDSNLTRKKKRFDLFFPLKAYSLYLRELLLKTLTPASLLHCEAPPSADDKKIPPLMVSFQCGNSQDQICPELPASDAAWLLLGISEKGYVYLKRVR